MGDFGIMVYGTRIFVINLKRGGVMFTVDSRTLSVPVTGSMTHGDIKQLVYREYRSTIKRHLCTTQAI